VLQSPLGDKNDLTSEYRLNSHYRVQSPLDEVIRKTQAGLDNFLTEKYAEEIQAVLTEWSVALRQYPFDFELIGRFLSPLVDGFSPYLSEEQCLRSEPGLQIWRKRFSNHQQYKRELLLRELGAFVSPFSKLITAEFKVASIVASAEPPILIRTRVRYDLVGSGSDYYREERVGHWDFEWERSPNGGLRIRKWHASEETRGRAARPIFVDVTSEVLHNISS